MYPISIVLPKSIGNTTGGESAAGFFALFSLIAYHFIVENHLIILDWFSDPGGSKCRIEFPS